MSDKDTNKKAVEADAETKAKAEAEAKAKAEQAEEEAKAKADMEKAIAEDPNMVTICCNGDVLRIHRDALKEHEGLGWKVKQ